MFDNSVAATKTDCDRTATERAKRLDPRTERPKAKSMNNYFQELTSIAGQNGKESAS
jgi:hypothetical protein